MAKTGSASKARRGGGVSKARGGGSRTPTIAAVAVLVILAAVVFGGIFYSQSSDTPAGGPAAAPIPVSTIQASYTASLQGPLVVAGRGPQVVDLYEDVQCPVCQQFEQLYGQKITDGLNANKLTVRYHLVNLLDESSNPPGYSTLGGNALMCAAENNAFPTLHKTLYDHQPPENGSGYSTQQLLDVGAAAGAGPGYAACVQNGAHSAQVKANFQQAMSDTSLQQTSGGSSGFGTPTVVINGKVVEPGTPQMDQALS